MTLLDTLYNLGAVYATRESLHLNLNFAAQVCPGCHRMDLVSGKPAYLTFPCHECGAVLVGDLFIKRRVKHACLSMMVKENVKMAFELHGPFPPEKGTQYEYAWNRLASATSEPPAHRILVFTSIPLLKLQFTPYSPVGEREGSETFETRYWSYASGEEKFAASFSEVTRVEKVEFPGGKSVHIEVESGKEVHVELEVEKPKPKKKGLEAWM